MQRLVFESPEGVTTVVFVLEAAKEQIVIAHYESKGYKLIGRFF